MTADVAMRDKLLEEAYRIADAEGLSALTVRRLARASHVSVGTVYNHFSSKDELTTAVIELYFRRSIMDEFCRLDANRGFVDYCEDLYASLVVILDRFRSHWLKNYGALPIAEKVSARLRERQILAHALRGLAEIYERDQDVRPSLPVECGAEPVSRFVLENMVSALRSGERSCPVLFGLLREALYRPGE